MEGFEKIDLDSDTKDEIPPASKVYSSRRVSGSKTNLPGFLRGKNSMKILAAVVIIILISGFTIILPAQKTLTSARKTYRQAQVTLNALKKQNVELASLELDKTKQGLEETQKNLKRF